MEQNLDQRVKKVVSDIKIIREQKGYKQVYLADKLKISQHAYSKIELGHTSLTVERLFAIAQIFEMDVIDIVKYRSPVPAEDIKVTG
ncbi:helix-turn-helix transcriptional regulator [Mucilaginibacter kameinonensis]|uniref:helix-turn-helix transcriptional regulator n=1 Tax=Mucilaginibacter kameinonensis TaxID=452286 RepID=UPI000EF79F35|nr:helix-turn-helix transcriptional regulator [Mucilaginibacter kameinonensis]